METFGDWKSVEKNIITTDKTGLKKCNIVFSFTAGRLLQQLQVHVLLSFTSAGCIFREPWMSVHNYVAVHLIDISRDKWNLWPAWGSMGFILCAPWMSVKKFHGNPHNSCWNVSIVEEKACDRQSLKDSSSLHHESLYNISSLSVQ